MLTLERSRLKFIGERILLISLTGILGAVFPLQAKDKPSIHVIVNASNPTSSMTRKEVSRLFLKKITKWSNGEKTLPADVVDTLSLRKEFSKEILNREVAAVKAYWQRLLFSGRSVPPPEFDTEEKILAYVHGKKGAIAYVSTKTSLAKFNVKILKIK
ncbi:substrate-binding domain-containing protein [bacterium]|nr:substrate-binding domain-containing protein [bacterium]